MASFPTSIVNFGFTAAAGKGLPYDVVQKQMDEIVALETALGTGLDVTPFTPTLTSAGGGAPTYAAASAGFVKLNKLVYVAGRITLTNKGTLAAGVVLIGALPFTVNTFYFGSCSVPFYVGLATSVSSLQGYMAASSNTVNLTYVPAVGATGITYLLVADISNTFDFLFSGTYLTP